MTTWEVIQYVKHEEDPKGWRFHPAVLPEPKQAVAWDSLAENVLYFSRMWNVEGTIAYDFLHDLAETIVSNLGLVPPKKRCTIEAWQDDKKIVYVSFATSGAPVKVCYMVGFDCTEKENPVVQFQQDLSLLVAYQPEYHHYREV